ncbi:MAG: TonB-dependent receptor plug domain-containing protein [Candidatus Schekmanbacteria bacterium]|nr:TonB-dependent receptor plug domain-containing protein [Candidatus Schekmanbacteria bacterium]
MLTSALAAQRGDALAWHLGSHDIDLVLTLEAVAPITSGYSPSHAVELHRGDAALRLAQGITASIDRDRAEVHLASGDTIPNKDFVYRWQVGSRRLHHGLLVNRRTGMTATLSSEELERLSSSSDPWSVLANVPGVMSDRINFSSSESGQASNFAGHGDGGENAVWNVDGVSITDAASAVVLPTSFDFDAFDEVAVTTSGAGPAQQTGGVGVNLLTRRGGDALVGSAKIRFGAADSDLLGGASGGEGRRGNLAVTLGGPLVRGRYWFWTALAHRQARGGTAPGVLGRGQDSTATIKMNGQPDANTKLTLLSALSRSAASGISDAAGRDAGDAGAATPEQSVPIEQTGRRRLDDIYCLDFRVANTRELGRSGSVTAELTVANALGARQALRRERLIGRSTLWDEREVSAGRTVGL